MREMWSKFPLPLDFKIYLFNVTNPKEIAQGEKPIVKEVGPFFYEWVKRLIYLSTVPRARRKLNNNNIILWSKTTYRSEYKEKVNLVDREEDDSVEYNLKATWYFNPSKSNGLTGEEELVLPHLLILAMVVTTLREKPTAIGILSELYRWNFHERSFVHSSEVSIDRSLFFFFFLLFRLDLKIIDNYNASLSGVSKEDEKLLLLVLFLLFFFLFFVSIRQLRETPFPWTTWPSR